MKKDFICDTHVHTKYSCDSTAELESYCLEAIKRGIYTICFTDHIDYNVNDDGYIYYNAKEFFGDFLSVKEKYHTKINLLCGIEFAEPHLYKDILAEYLKLPYDYILGSIHWWYNDMFPSKMVKENIPAEICYEYYWDEALKAVEAGGFDSLAHFDFPKRYYKRLIVDFDKINKIFNAMVRNNICLEINTSSLRKDVPESMPDKEILTVYKSCGGKYITVGSDAHAPGELAADHLYAKKLIEFFEFEEVIFNQRKMII